MRWLTETSTIADGNMSLRYGEQNEVLQNRQRFLEKIGLSAEQCVVMDSKHQDIVHIINDIKTEKRVGLGAAILADTFVTQEKNLTLLLTTADCLPISFFDLVTETTGLMHLSRHTFVLDLIEKTFSSLSDLGVEPANLEVVIGPHIHRDSYCFSLPLNEEPEKMKPYVHKSGDKAQVDLTQAAIDTLTAHGVLPTNISISPIDTYTSQDHFSHVRSAKNNEPEGRIMTVVSLQE